MPPGWYPADGDPPGTQRYWDGQTWQGGPQPIATAPGVGVGGVPVSMYPESSQAVLALILSILGFVACCGITCPIGWWLGDQELKAIAEGRRDPSNQGTANAGKIVGIIGTVLILLAVVGFVGISLLGAASA